MRRASSPTTRNAPRRAMGRIMRRWPTTAPALSRINTTPTSPASPQAIPTVASGRMVMGAAVVVIGRGWQIACSVAYSDNGRLLRRSNLSLHPRYPSRREKSSATRSLREGSMTRPASHLISRGFPTSRESRGKPCISNIQARTVSTLLQPTEWLDSNRHHQDGRGIIIKMSGRCSLLPRHIHFRTGHTGSKGLGNLPGRKSERMFLELKMMDQGYENAVAEFEAKYAISL